jgi:COP9 signalosome complex subunit 5
LQTVILKIYLITIKKNKFSFIYRYYSLDVTYFKSVLDKSLLEFLWNRYWVNTLSSSNLLTVNLLTLISIITVILSFTFKNADYTTGQIFDIADKLEEAESQLGKGNFAGTFDFPDSSKNSEDKLSKACKDR